MTMTATQTISGSGNSANMFGAVGGDVHIGDRYTAEDSFFEPSLKGLEAGDWVDPPAACALLDDLEQQRVLILDGELDEKRECAQHLALRLQKRLETAGQILQVRQRTGGREPFRIESVCEQNRPTLLLLFDIVPGSIIGHSALSALSRWLRSRGAYAILTTTCSREEWEAHGGSFDRSCWQELYWDTYYGAELLVHFLRCQLPESPESNSLSFDLIVQKLKSPGKVKAFASWIRESPTFPSNARITDQLALLDGELSAVSKWYQQFDSRDQLLILALTIFDGLPVEVAFLGLEELVESIWRAADPLLPQFDHRDLTRLSTYYRVLETEDGISRIECASQERRDQILQLAWNTQRRRLLATLPVLTDLIRWSAKSSGEIDGSAKSPLSSLPTVETPGRSSNRGTRRAGFSRRESVQLHTALVESLSRISLLSFDVVEPQLFELALDNSKTVRRFIAFVLACWWQNHERKLLDLLENWWRRSEVGHGHHPGTAMSQEKRTALRAVITLVLGHIARFSAPNRFSHKCLQLLTTLFAESDPAIREALRSTVESLVAGHFRQVERLVSSQLLLAGDLLEPIARGAAEAWAERPDETLAILDSWRVMKEAPRERRLGVVALAHGFVLTDDHRPELSASTIEARLRTLLQESSQGYARHCVFFAIECQATRHFQKMANLLHATLTLISIQDRPSVVEVLVRVYLHQRSQLEGSDERITIGETSFPIWRATTRPLTVVETNLYSWLSSVLQPATQQLAVEVFEALAETKLERTERDLRSRRIEPSIRSSTQPSDVQQPSVYPLPLLGSLALKLAAPRSPPMGLGPLLAELIVVQERRSSPRTRSSSLLHRPKEPVLAIDRCEELLRRWERNPKEPSKGNTETLRRALRLYRWRWPLVISAALLATLLFLILLFLLLMAAY